MLEFVPQYFIVILKKVHVLNVRQLKDNIPQHYLKIYYLKSRYSGVWTMQNKNKTSHAKPQFV